MIEVSMNTHFLDHFVANYNNNKSLKNTDIELIFYILF